MKLLIDTGIAKSGNLEARWEMFQEDTDNPPPSVQIEVYIYVGESQIRQKLGGLYITELSADGIATITEEEHTEYPQKPLALSGPLVYLDPKTWAHMALNIFDNL